MEEAISYNRFRFYPCEMKEADSVPRGRALLSWKFYLARTKRRRFLQLARFGHRESWEHPIGSQQKKKHSLNEV